MIHFYGSPMSSAVRTHWMLEEVGVPYEYHRINLRAGDQRKPEYLAINPHGKIPCIRDGSLTLVESMAINFYLAEKYGKDLMPRNVEEKGEVYQWSFWAISNLQPLLLTVLLNTMFLPESERDPKAVEKAREQIPSYLGIIDGALKGKPYLVGGRFTVADVNAGSVLELATMLGFDLDATPDLKGWLDRLHARPAFQRLAVAG